MREYAKVMIPFHVDRACLSPATDNAITNLCWTAQEILTAHTRTPATLILSREADVDATDAPSDADDEEAEYRDMITELSTAPTRINMQQTVSLTNTPYVLNDMGKLMLYAEPGYVALLGDSLSSAAPKRSFGNLAQLIFRLPNPYQPAGAIYNGVTFEDTHEISQNQPLVISEITRVLTAVRLGLRGLAVTDPVVYRTLYRSRIPTPVVGHFDDETFNTFFSS